MGAGKGSGEGAGKGTGSCCAKTILIVTNILFFLVGLAFFAAGIALKFASQYVQPYVDQATQSIPNIAASADVSNPNSSSGTITINVDEFLGDFAIVFICVGLFIMIVGVLGMCGACCTSKCMLITYALIVFVLILIELACVVIIVTGVLNVKIKDQFKTLINTKYGGIDSFDRDSLFFNVIMLQFKCCGIDNYADFNTSTSWTNTRSFNYTDPGSGTVTTITRALVTPIACCKMDADFPNGTPLDNTCTFSPNSTNSNYDKGCFSEVTNFVITSYKMPLLGGVAGVFVFEFILVILAIIISKTSHSDGSKVEPF